MDYLTFRLGRLSIGTIQCIESAYDFESEKFTVSFLKHERHTQKT